MISSPLEGTFSRIFLETNFVLRSLDVAETPVGAGHVIFGVDIALCNVSYLP
jgi:hypothetical protein